MATSSRLIRSHPDRLLKVYGHIRSGNNYLAECLRLNFYPDADLGGEPGYWGHWSDRQYTDGKAYGLLLGNHEHYRTARPEAGAIYVHRDGRAVAHSAWRSPHFMNAAWRGITLSDYLRKPIDWDATPAHRRRLPIRRENIIQHWLRHVSGWLESGDPRVGFVRYEDLAGNPTRVVQAIADFFGLELAGASGHVSIPGKPVGYSPSSMPDSAWRNALSSDDLDFYDSIVGRDMAELRAAHALGAT
jgi:hypothetical protein